jgi:predicted nucleic acid-binding protein
VKITDALVGIKRLCIETAPFIYYVERHPVYLERVRPAIQLIDNGTLRGFSSTVTLTEVLTQPLKTGNTQIVSEYRNILLHSRHFTLVPIDAVIAERAAEFRARYNLRTPDALQVAAAVQAACDAFLTNDLSLRRVREISVLVLDQLDPPDTNT